MLRTTAMMGMRPSPRSCADCTTCRLVEWSELDQAGMQQLTTSRCAFDYQSGEAIFHQSDEPRGIYCIAEGNVILFQCDSFGNEIGFGVRYQDETIGWRSFFAGENHTATALALTPCKICLIPGNTVRRLIKNYPGLARRFLITVARDRGPAESLLLRNPRLPARIRMINFLLILCKNIFASSPGKEVRVRLPISRQQIASLIGLRAETLSRTIAALQKEGLANFQARQVNIHNYERLVNESIRGKRFR